MKCLLTLLIQLCVTSSLIAQITLKAGLVAYYSFNGDFRDESTNKNHPVKINATLTADRFGKAKSACYFDGIDDYIRIANHPSLNFGRSFSISAWVRVDGFYRGTCHGNRMIMKGPADYLDGNYFLTFDDNYSTNGSNCEIPKPDIKRQTFYGPDAAPTGPHYIIPGKWYLLTYINDGKNISLYSGCILVASGKSPGTQFTNSYDLFFGKMDNSQYPYSFNGCLDEVRLYNRTLTKDEIKALCNTSSTEPCTGINKPDASFSYTLSNCSTAMFRLKARTKNETESVRWSFGDGAFSKNNTPGHNYVKPGTYTVKTIVTSKSGCSDTFSRKITIEKLKTDFVYQEKGGPGEIEFKSLNNRALYSWDFGNGMTTENESSKTIVYNKPGDYVVKLFAQTTAGCADTASHTLHIALPSDSSQKGIFIPETIPLPLTKVPQLPERREKDIQQVIQIDNDSITISLFDNGIIDGDSVTIIYNDEVIAQHLLLSSQPVVFRLKVDRGKAGNELIMYAENLGSIPPNTALMSIADGNKRHTVNISSTKKSNGAVSFVLKK